MSSRSQMKSPYRRGTPKRTQGYRKLQRKLQGPPSRDGWLLRLWKKVFF